MPPVLRSDAPIGVFDSGLGGLTVVARLRELLPRERLVYVADQAHVPYGGRDLNEICGFACGISQALLEYGCKAVVMACNISSATALSVVQRDFADVPICGTILPGAQEAASQTVNGSVGVLTTAGTRKTGAYTRALLAHNPDLQVAEVACPRFVPLVEAGLEGSPAAREACREYLAPLLSARTDTVILGCTHYPFLLPVLTELAPSARFIDPALQTVRHLADLLADRRLLRPDDAASAPDLLTTTGDVTAFAVQLHRFLPADNSTLRAAVWNGAALALPR